MKCSAFVSSVPPAALSEIQSVPPSHMLDFLKEIGLFFYDTNISDYSDFFAHEFSVAQNGCSFTPADYL